MTDYWLIRFENGNALIWKRKYFLGFIAIPWAWHGGTDIVRTKDAHDNVLEAALDYIVSQTKVANIRVIL